MIDEQVVYRTASHLEFHDVGDDQVKIINKAYRTGFTGPKALLEVLRFFETPATVGQFRQQFEGIDDDIFSELSRERLLLEEQTYGVLNWGLTTAVPASIGVERRPHDLTKAAQTAFAIIGASTDVLALGASGARAGPSEVRRVKGYRFGADVAPDANGPRPLPSLYDIEGRRTVSLSSFEVVDLGDVVSVSGEPMNDYGLRLEATVRHAVAAGFTPIVIGGDHSVSRSPLNVFAERFAETGFGIIHFDAHHDLYPALRGTVTHANPFQQVLENKSLKYLFQVGLRTLEPVLPVEQVAPQFDNRISYVSSEELQHLRAEEVFAGVPRDLPCYLTFDVDCMSPQLCPETGTPTQGGLSYYQARALVGYAAKTFRCIGADFVEVAGSGALFNGAAATVRSLLTHFVLAHAPSEPLKTYLQVMKPPSGVPRGE